MELIPQFVQKFFSRIGNLLSAVPDAIFRREPFTPLPPLPLVEPAPPEAAPEKRKRRRRGESKKTLADLLDNLEVAFQKMRMPIDGNSWLDRGSILGLRRLGVYVPDPWELTWHDDPAQLRVDVNGLMPVFMAVSFSGEASFKEFEANPPKDKDIYTANTMFAVKREKTPFYVEQKKGVVYEFGYSFADTKNFWMRCFLVIDESTGEIHICDELKRKVHIIAAKQRRKGRPVHHSFTTKQWSDPYLLAADDLCDLETRKLGAKNLFVAMLKWWRDRDLRWSVGIKRGKDRVIFSVEPENTKTYFADRDKTVKTANGQTKKIIHYVREHERVRNGKTISVREHIRGLREFNWKGHHCIITAPKFHKTILSNSWELTPMDEEETAAYKGKMVYAPGVAKKLVELEEMDLRPARNKGKRRVNH